jgi:iduronate 2-sulfatase
MNTRLHSFSVPWFVSVRLRHLAGVVLALLAGTCLDAAVGVARPKNVLFIVADDLRPELGCYGVPGVITPNLDALAGRGVVFNRAYCQQAVCNPSRSSALTGLRPDRIRVWDLGARFRETTPEAVTLPEYFKTRGYFTQGVGKIFHNETRVVPGRVSFTDPDSWSVPPIHATGAHWEDDPTNPAAKGGVIQAIEVADEAYFDGQIARDAVAALDQLSRRSEPFFLAVGFWKPHLPFNAPKKYWDLYERRQFASRDLAGFPNGAPEIARHNWSELRGYGGVPKEGALKDGQAAELWHGYYAGVSFLDAQVGKVLTRLRELGLEDDTIVVFWGDHGFHLGEHDLWAKTSNYELDARVPLIVTAPGVGKPGVRTDALVELVDVFPTVADLAGLPAPVGLDGMSLKAHLADPALPGKEFALTQHPHPFYGARWTAMGYALRTDRYRYIEWRDRATGMIMARELYDHADDSRETRNLIGSPRHAAAAGQLEQLARRAYRFVPEPRR